MTAAPGRRRRLGALTACALALAAACERPAGTGAMPAGAAAAPAAVPASVPVAPDGRAIYNFRCYFCHGYSGNAKTLAASYLVPPPRDFTTARPEELTPARIDAAIRDGRPGTAMKSFRSILSDAEIRALAGFVHEEFVVRKAENTRYHTPENGWPAHERYRNAYPFARGEVALTVRPETLSPDLQAGRRLYLESCVSCHDRGAPVEDGAVWDARPLSYPRNNYDHRRPEVDASTSATPYRLHDVPPKLAGLSARQREGERLFQANCAFCHAADGTGKNWIGSFLEPHPRDLTDPRFMAAMSRARLARTIRDGLPGTSMPAWQAVLSGEEIDAIVAYVDRAFHPLR